MVKARKKGKIINIDEIINNPDVQKNSLELYNIAGRLKEKHFVNRFSV